MNTHIFISYNGRVKAIAAPTVAEATQKSYWSDRYVGSVSEDCPLEVIASSAAQYQVNNTNDGNSIPESDWSVISWIVVAGIGLALLGFGLFQADYRYILVASGYEVGMVLSCSLTQSITKKQK